MRKLVFFLLFCVFYTPLFAQWEARHNLSSSAYQNEVNKLVNQGYRISQVSGYSDGGQDRYAAIFEKITNPPAWEARHNMNSDQYQSVVNDMVKKGYRPVQVSGFASGGQAKFAALFEKNPNTPPWTARHNLSSEQYQKEVEEWVKKGYRLADVSGYTVNNKDFYTAIFDKPANAPDWVARHSMSSAQYQDEFNKWTGQGYRLKKVSGYSISGQPQFAAIWEKSGSGYSAARHSMTSREYQDEMERFYFMGYRPVWVNGYTVGNNDYYAAIWESKNGFDQNDLNEVDKLVKNFMDDFEIPGLSFALAKDDKLVLAKTFGLADKENRERVAPRHRFRIASCAKPITATAIMKLVSQNKLELGDKVFGIGGVFGNAYGTIPYKQWITDITVQQLLEHTSGGWTNDGNDPMFKNAELNHKELISWTLDNQSLKNKPGTDYAYSNFGYCVLGRIIEKKTVQTYENYIKKNILAPCGISNMEIGGNKKADRKTNEVVYYGQNGDDPYCCNVERMDSHGGWIATPVDLVRFLVRVDKFSGKSDILPPRILSIMFTPSAKNNGYAKGWSVNSSDNYWHNGSLPGEQAWMVRTGSGYCWSILVNTKSGKSGFGNAMDKLMWDITKAINKWPTFDLF